MKQKTILALAAVFALVNASVLAQEQKVIAVATFDITGNAVTQDEADAITELFITELVSTGKVSVVDRANFDKIVKEMKFQASDWSDSAKTTALGNAANAHLISRGQIIKLGSKLYLSSSIIDAKNAKVLSSAREQFNSLDDVFGLLGNFANTVAVGISKEIGTIGPGGGIIFYVEGNKSYEVSELLGTGNSNEAKKMCKDYRGGGYDDWYLPTKDELNLVYQNLRKTGKISGNDKYWSSSYCRVYYTLWGQRFNDGYQDVYGWENILSVRAVRAF
ncbi:MAG: DUF1566 domain-containing protein [Treponemataceae bacterium]|nr:DUF1566 domain-containing protein [Treponemataceae bacterium]